MPNRVLVKGGVAAALQVSLPGYDVLTAPLSGMAFDARFANMMPVLSGVVFVQWETNTRVNFGTTFSSIPRLFCGFSPTSNSPNSNPVRITSPACVLTSGVGTNLFLIVADVDAAGFTAWSSTTGDTDIRPFASAYLWYSAYR